MAAAKRAEGGMSVSRSAGAQRSSEEEARRQKVEAQRKYALELQDQQSARQRSDHLQTHPEDRKRVQRRAQSPIQQSSILSSPTSTYTSAAARQRGGGGPSSDREKARQKQADYYRQLDADKQAVAIGSARGAPTVREQPRAPSPISRGSRHDSSDGNRGAQPSERDLKHQRQQEYAQQLKLDMKKNDSMAMKRDSGSNSESSIQRHKPEGDLGINFGGAQPQRTRREKQEEYARQIREAAQQEAISTPRQALSARRQGHSSPDKGKGRVDSNTGTGLALGADIATAAERASKRERQSQYRNELASGSNSKPITSSRVSLVSHRSKQDEELGVRGGGAAGFSTAGLIGHQESDYDRLQRKRESQREYFNQLQAGPSPTKNKNRDLQLNENYEESRNGGGRSAGYDNREEEYEYARDESQYDLGEPVSALSQRLANAYNDPYQHESGPEPPYRAPAQQRQQHQQYDQQYDHQYDDHSSRAGMRQDSTGSLNAIEQMRAEAQSRIRDEDQQHLHLQHSSPTRPVVAEDGNVSFDGINPPYGRHNKGMNVPDREGNMPSARRAQPPQRGPASYQQQQRQQQEEQDHKEQLYHQAHQGTSLIIGKMDVQTSDHRDRRAHEQQKYVQALEHERTREPIQSERVSLIQQSKYQGNGLPGSNVPQQMQGGNRRGGANNNIFQQQGQQQGQYAGHRGTSNGGGVSSVVLGGGYGAEGSPRMQRRGGREEYAEQLQQQRQPQELYAQHQQYYQQEDGGDEYYDAHGGMR